MKQAKLTLLTVLATGYLLGGCSKEDQDDNGLPYPLINDSFNTEQVAEGFTVPYGIAILSENEYFVTDRIGTLYHFEEGTLNEVSGMPEVITFGDPGIAAILHGGLMDVSLHPDFETNGWIYISYLGTDGIARVSRFKVVNNAVSQFENVFETRTAGFYGNGMRIEWEDATHFFLNVGASTLSTNTEPILIAQDLNEDWGKVHRLNDDGTVPSDNPVLPGQSGPLSIWSYGHRDSQGLTYEASTQTLFGVEHGPKGGDEFNIIESGENYGWPLFTYGINYDGAGVSTISEDSAASFTVLPEHYWTVPTSDGGRAIGPSFLLKVEGSNVTDWNGFFLLGSLPYQRLLKYNRQTNETFSLNIEGRVRTAKQLPNGDIIALIERSSVGATDGKLIRISN